jgi:hypothetical protein
MPASRPIFETPSPKWASLKAAGCIAIFHEKIPSATVERLHFKKLMTNSNAVAEATSTTEGAQADRRRRDTTEHRLRLHRQPGDDFKVGG